MSMKWVASSGALAVLLVSGLSACAPSKMEAVTYPVENPSHLSDWGFFDVSSGALELSDGVLPYDLNAPLFTDYAHKLRTIWVPTDAPTADLNTGGVPDLPVGTVISKTFYYSKADAAETSVLKSEDPAGIFNPALGDLQSIRLMETRLLVRREQGWEPVSYVWNEAQTDAVLTKIGDVEALTLVDPAGDSSEFTYVVPDINQCAGCHAPNNTTREIEPLGLRARHINKPYLHDGDERNQLDYFVEQGVLSEIGDTKSIPANADWTDASLSLEQRARSYLDINCAHCHNPVGPADTSGLDLTVDAADGPALGLCKLPIAAGSGTGGRAFSIVPSAPDESILVYRLETTKPGAMMPELGRALSHAEGVALVREWIASMDGDCAT